MIGDEDSAYIPRYTSMMELRRQIVNPIEGMVVYVGPWAKMIYLDGKWDWKSSSPGEVHLN